MEHSLCRTSALWHLPTLKLRNRMANPNDIPAPTKPLMAGCQQEPCCASFEVRGAYLLAPHSHKMATAETLAETILRMEEMSPTSEVMVSSGKWVTTHDGYTEPKWVPHSSHNDLAQTRRAGD